MTEATKCAHGQLSCELCQWTDGYAREVLLSGNETSPIDENAILAAVSARMEAEALAESEAMAAQPVWPDKPEPRLRFVPKQEVDAGLPAPTMRYPEWAAQAGIPTPLDDLRVRLEACVAAGVTVYRDGQLEIRFDPYARKAAMKNAGGTITSF